MKRNFKYQISNIKFPMIGLFVYSFIYLFVYLLLPAQAGATLGNTRTINFQGRVVNKSDGTNISDSNYSFTFKLYDAASGGNLLWQETQSSVALTNGIFQVQLGSSTAFNAGGYNVNFNTSPLYLDITFNSETFGTRVQLATVPYALNAETLDGVIATSSATGFTLTGGQSNPKTLTVNNSLGLSGTDGTTFTFPTTSGGTVLTSNAPTQTITSTQTTGSILGISDSTAETAATTGLSITMSGTGAFDQTGLSFNLSNASGTNLNDIVGSGSTWKISKAGALTVASCSGCSGVAAGGLVQVPTSNTAGATSANVVAPTAAGIIGMTINGTSNSSTTADALDVNTIPATGLTATNGLLVQQNGAGTTTNGLQIQRSSGTLTNGLTFTGTMTNYVNATGFTVTSGGAVSDNSESITPGASTTGLTITQNNVPSVDIAQITNSGHTAALNGVNALQLTFDSGPTNSTDQNGALRVNINNKGTGAGQSNGIRIVATGAGGAVNSATVGLQIDALTTSTTGNNSENAINIGSGWDNAISAAGNVLIESQSNTADANARTWTVKNATAGTLQTTPVIASISASVVYNGSLYVGTYNNAKGELYRYNGPSAGTFSAINTTAGTMASQTNIDGVTSLAVYNGYLYVGTSKVNAGAGQAEVYRYDGGNTLTLVTAGGGSIGGVAAQASVSAMTVWNGDLYAGTCKSGAGEVFKYQGGTTWIAVSGAGTLNTTANIDCVSSLISYNNYLIAGSKRTGTAEVYRYTGGTGWIRLNPTAGTFTLTSSGGTAVSAADGVRSMVVYDGHLVVALQKAAGADIVEYDDVVGALAPVNDWSRLNSVSGTIGTTASVNAVSSMAVYNGRLYVGTDSTAGGEIWRYDSGEISTTGWTKVSQNTKGIIGSTGTPTTNIDAVTQLLQYNNDLWAGTSKVGAAELYTYTFIAGQSYALKFNAPTTQALQNGLENLGTIAFEASPSATMGNGGFVFSNGIVTNAGAYDVAEDYPTRDQLIKPGDLVAIDTSEKGLVKRSDRARSTTVIGVYSANPGFDLSQQGNHIDGLPAIPVALVGRVLVNVSTESGHIQSGDYITSSSTSGIGMKAVSAGPIIGQALEGFDGLSCSSVIPGSDQGSMDSRLLGNDNGGGNDNTCVGQILVFVSHGYFNGMSQQELAGLSGSGDLSAVQFIDSADQNVIVASNSRSVIPDLIGDPQASMDSRIRGNDIGSGNDNGIALSSLSVTGLATISADLRVKHNALIEGILSVVDTIMANNVITNGLADFFGQVIFHSDVMFQKSPTFAQDTAGYAVIHKGASFVDIKFATPYVSAPVINATLVALPTIAPIPSVDPLQALQSTIAVNGYSYVITNVSPTGFTLVLSKQAVDDVSFSWTAFLVNKPVTFTSKQDSAIAGAADISTAPLASSSGQ